ncbi:MAG: hypothetical protein VX527_08390 [Planctomycetota bacterium]|nr:hypothetical protein [Planctomycetota bacterium]
MRSILAITISLLVLTGMPSIVHAQGDSASEATQKITLDNGKSWRGHVGDQVTIEWRDGAAQPRMTGSLDLIARLYVKFTPNDTGKERVILLRSILSIESVDTDDEAPQGSDAGKQGSDKSKAKDSDGKTSGGDSADKTGLLILPLSGTVGIEFRPEEIEEITRQADERGDGQVIVLEIDSGGGLVAEGMLIKEAIYDACERHTVVAWIDHAISGASWTALCCDVIVFKQHGHTGGITIMIGNKTAPDATVNAWIPEIEKLLREKGRSTYWAKPFVLEDSYLSATKDPDTGKVTWYPNLKGERIFSGPGQNLMFNADEAVEFGFAIGKANTHEELAEVLQLKNWELAGEGQELHDRRGELKEKLVDTIKKQMRELGRLGTTRSDMNKAIKILQSWLRWWKVAPNQCAMVAGLPKPEKIEELIEEMRYQLRQMAAGSGGGRGGGGGRGR